MQKGWCYMRGTMQEGGVIYYKGYYAGRGDVI